MESPMRKAAAFGVNTGEKVVYAVIVESLQQREKMNRARNKILLLSLVCAFINF